MSTNRRSFIRNAAIGTLASISIPEIVAAATASAKGKRISLSENDVVLFQGDSITDAGRGKKDTGANNAALMGNGYAFYAGATLLNEHTNKKLQIYNKGISGNKVYQLADRWDAECITLKPNVLSILVGVNDFWHTITSGYTGTIETYRTDYKKLLDRTKQALPDVKLIIGEPYALRGIKSVTDAWYPKFDEFRVAAKELADQFDAAFIPYQSIYDKATEKAPGSYWTADGVHPTMAGAALMAEAWLQTVKG
ncbi:lysophospholipase L1-like esterase [Mucilaginibacter yixingensis]|uniref:Lysophospholipase L1-like esterase n=1 Tax=Mucilaginibacter yixingensis TaxID=1295612 RepID=A0A2T5J6G9_9SPHI|nr:SGNH/GDSL hydrolase family protein [Mucilaginibacter yixingensis]PTQ94148.1 lysophospholipase L1-like esterase [Mucilaginibacter yixingensis]